VFARRPLAMIPENLLKYGVGLLLASFGTFWAIEGVGIFRTGRHSVAWAGNDLSILGLIVVWFILTRVFIVALRPREMAPAGVRESETVERTAL